jgi:hypothetical protein
MPLQFNGYVLRPGAASNRSINRVLVIKNERMQSAAHSRPRGDCCAMPRRPNNALILHHGVNLSLMGFS